jgi:RNA polymerase sigma factor (TIGR02999 family)
MEEERRTGASKPEPNNVTTGLRRLGSGQSGVSRGVESFLERELHRLASATMRKERQGHTLSTTGLVNEAYLRLFARKKSHWNDRLHFLADASRVMRRVLVDHFRRRQVRSPLGMRVEFDASLHGVDSISVQALDMDRALKALARIAPRQARLVELRFFGGCSLEEAAALLEISPRTADKDWVLARAWLKSHLDAGGESPNEPT